MLMPFPVEVICEIKNKQEERVLQVVQKLSELQTGMTLDELDTLVRFVERLRETGNYSESYLRKEAVNTPRTIEIDPATKRIFIHLKTKNVPQVGKGVHKEVTQSILYDPEHPKLVANAVVDDDEKSRSEVELLEKLRNTECVIEPLHLSRHEKKCGQPRLEIITPLYNRGCLRRFIENNPRSIPLHVKVKIAKDILTGSVRLNEKGYVNRDNNKGNFFIHEENGVYRTVVGDLGGYTAEFSVALQKKPFGPGARSAPPDLHKAYYEDRLCADDLLSFHIYSLGRILYFLLHEEDVPWIEGFNENYPLIKHLNRDRTNSDVLREIEEYTQKIVANTKPRIDELTPRFEEHTLEGHELFEYAVLRMLSVEPELRKTNAYWQKVFETFPGL
jgi:serine/threonine protein kinase